MYGSLLKVKMVATLICPTSCGFARMAALEIVKEKTQTFRQENGEGTAKFRACSMQECYKRFNESFQGVCYCFSEISKENTSSLRYIQPLESEKERREGKGTWQHSLFKTGTK